MTTSITSTEPKNFLLHESKFLDVVAGSTTKSVASSALVKILRDRPDITGRLFIGYPIARTSTELNCIDALWVSPTFGVIAFDLIEEDQLGDYIVHQDDIVNQLVIQLRRGEPRLVRKRKLKVPIEVVTYSPTPLNGDRVEDYPVLDPETITQYLENLKPKIGNLQDRYELILSALEYVTHLGKPKIVRTGRSPNSFGNRLSKLETSIKTLEYQQSKAVLETVNGVQRLRGLAGSGKTIVLALKAAYLHAQNPDWRIGVTFQTRSLKTFFRRLIRQFHIKRIDEEPNWTNLSILNSWGGPGKSERNGIYYEFCIENEVDYLNFDTARMKFGYEVAFDRACKQALEQSAPVKPLYDAILIDEAQDLPPSFLVLCYEFLKDPKRLVYAYDELQNLYRESLPSPEIMFGRDVDGLPKVTLDYDDPTQPNPDLILHTCYRNPGPLLATAHAIGFGIYRIPTEDTGTGLVQMFDRPHLWEDVGYEVTNGTLAEGELVTLKRTHNTSPLFLEQHSSLNELIEFKTFETVKQQANWVVKSIEHNLSVDDLDHSDIMVINLEPYTTRESMGPIQSMLMNLKIHSHLAGVDTDPDVFDLDDVKSITFTGIHRAKGNEAAMVYIINAESGVSSTSNLASFRNRLFTAITRSKAWVRISGVGQGIEVLEQEYKKLRSKRFELRFRYPSAEQRTNLRTIYRDSTEREKRRSRDQNQIARDLVSDWELGEGSAEDLDPQVAERLYRWLQRSQT